MIPIPFDYETLRLLWWALLGVLLIGFAATDGFDMGVAALLPWVGRNDTQKRVALNTVGPVWEGNQVWLITGGGAIFAAWPAIYAASFSGFYLAMILVLFTLILRPVGFEYRNKFNVRYRKWWDLGLFLGGVVPPLVFGVAFGNLFKGIPFYLDTNQMPHYAENGFIGLIHLLNPFALLCGLASFGMITAHGGVFLAAKSRGDVQKRAIQSIYVFSLLWLVMFIIGGFWVRHLPGVALTMPMAHDGPSNPLLKQAAIIPGAWAANFNAHPLLYIVPALAILACVGTLMLTARGRHATAYITSTLTIACTITTAAVALFPFMMPSSANPVSSLTVWDSSSSQLSLWLMLIAAVVLVPIVLAYTGWAFRVMREALTEAHITKNSDSMY